MSDIRLPLENELAAKARAAENLRDRFAAQITFGRWLCGVNPESAGPWSEILDAAEHRFSPVLESGSVAEIEAVLAETEATFAPIADTAADYTVYCVGHAHIDMNWMWSWPETVAVTNDTFTSVLRLMDEFPTFKFSQSQASVYRIIEKYNPPMLEEIGRLIREGRWEVTASHWVETEKNIVSGESLCRHILYTRKYLKELFDLNPADVRIDWSPDTFGHALTVPTYLAKSEVEYLYLHRPGAHGEQPRPRAFWWQGPDNSKVLTWNDMEFGYNGRILSQSLLRSMAETYKATSLPFTMFVYGVGDHGGGPTRRDLVQAGKMDSWPLFPHIEFSTAHSFYDRLKEEGSELPVLDYELNFEFTGCYTSQSVIKKANRYSEKKLIGAETASVAAEAAAGFAYPFDIFEEGWRNTLFNHFHDIIPGSGVHDTRTYAHGLYQETVAGTGVSSALALRALAAQVDTSDGNSAPEAPSIAAGVGRGTGNGGMSEYEFFSGDGTRNIMLFNPLPYPREEIVETTIWEGFVPWNDQESVEFTVTSPDGETATAQVLERSGYWGHRYIRIAYAAKVPGIGYAVYKVEETEGKTEKEGVRQIGLSHVCNYALYERGPEGLENDLVALHLDPVSGGIRRLTDSKSGIDIISEEGPVHPLLRFLVEKPRPMSAWEIEHGGPEIDPELTKLERIQEGPLVASIRASYTVADSKAHLTYKLNHGDPTLYLDLKVEWNERGSRDRGTPSLKLAIPTNFDSPEATYEIPFGSIARHMKYGEEVPALRWASVTGEVKGKSAGLLLLNDSKHGHALSKNTLSLSLIRSSFEPDSHPEIGNHEIHLGIRPSAKALPVAEAVHCGRVFDQPMEAVATDVHSGKLAKQAGMITCSSKNLVLDTVKKAEDGRGIIVKIHNPSDRSAEANLEFDDAIFGKVMETAETDLMERPTSGNGAKISSGNVTVSVPAYGISAVRVIFG